MAISFESLLTDILPLVAGCTDTMAEKAIRSATIELCEKSDIYQIELDPTTTQEGIYEYDFDTPNQTSVQKIMWATHDGKDLEPISSTLLEQREPGWRKPDKFSVPKYITKHSQISFRLVPVPNSTLTNGTIIRVSLKPTNTSAACDELVMADNRDTIISGALFRLLRMPAQVWTDYSGAQIYGAAFAEGIRDAELKARHADVGVARRVKYGGIPQRTRHAKRGWRTAY